MTRAVQPMTAVAGATKPPGHREFRTVVDVARPVEEVFAYVTQPENVPQYSPIVIEARRAKSGPIALGSTAILLCQVFGRRFELRGRVGAFAPNRKFVLETTSGPLEVEAELTFETIQGGTRITSVLRGRDGGLFQLAQPLLLGMASTRFRASARSLKTILEAPRVGSKHAGVAP